PLRYRTSLTSDGSYPGACSHPSQTSFAFKNTALYDKLRLSMVSYDAMTRISSPTGAKYPVIRVGSAGTCADKSGPHNSAEAFDLTHIRCTSASSANYFDARWSWTGNDFHKMRYLSVVAHLRRSFGYIMTVWSDSDGSHWNHIHIDNYYRPFGLLMSGSSSW